MTMTVNKKCPFCGEITKVVVLVEDYLKWNRGELIQNAMPYLNETDRETLISGLCARCQDSFFEVEEYENE